MTSTPPHINRIVRSIVTVMSFPGKSLQNHCGAVQDSVVEIRKKIQKSNKDEEYHASIVMMSPVRERYAVEKKQSSILPCSTPEGR